LGCTSYIVLIVAIGLVVEKPTGDDDELVDEEEQQLLK
jgi:hypothetical protein